MIKPFKFLTDNDEDGLEYDGFVYNLQDGYASWMWANPEIAQGDSRWSPEEMVVTNIRTFLMNFPEQMIVPIISITGDNITMTIANDHDPWPFNILGGTPLHIVYLRWIPE